MFDDSLIINRSTWTALVTAVEALLIVALIASMVVGDLGTRRSLKAHFVFISDNHHFMFISDNHHNTRRGKKIWKEPISRTNIKKIADPIFIKITQ